MAKPKKDKSPTYTYIKEFIEFGDGYKELVALIPNVGLYGGDTEMTMEGVVASLTKTINDNVPSPLNENYPNTFSFSINAREMGFLTDDGIAFGWRIFINKNDESLSYQFRVTFTSLSVSKRKQIDRLTSHGWKERDLSDKQSRFWNEAVSSQRAAVREGDEVANPSTPKPHVQTVHVEPTPTPTTAKAATMVEDQTTIQEEAVVLPTKVGIKVSVDAPTPVTTREEPKPFFSKPQSAPIQQVKISDSEQEAEQQQQSEQLKEQAQKQCSILPGGTAAVFVITHYGKQHVININDRNDGVYLDRASSTIKIDNVLYNYRKFQVRILDQDYQHEQAQFAPGLGDRLMREHPPLPDEAFVGGKMVNENAAAVPDHTIIPPPKPKLTIAQQKMVDQESNASLNLIPPPGQSQSFQGGAVLKAGKSFVIDRTPKAPINDTNGVADQTVRVTDNLYGSN